MIQPYYQDSHVTIYNTDSIEFVDRMRDLGIVPELMVTDPPYSSGARRDADRQTRGAMSRSIEDEDWFSHDTMTTFGYSWFIRGLFWRLLPILIGGAHTYVFSDWRISPQVFGLLESCSYRVNNRITWDKDELGMGTYWRNQTEDIVFGSKGQPLRMLRADRPNVVTIPGIHHAKRVYPTEKPVALMRWIIESVPGDLVFDPFCGSGPVLQAAKDLGRRAVGVDISEEACERAAERCRQEVLRFA